VGGDAITIRQSCKCKIDPLIQYHIGQRSTESANDSALRWLPPDSWRALVSVDGPTACRWSQICILTFRFLSALRGQAESARSCSIWTIYSGLLTEARHRRQIKKNEVQTVQVVQSPGSSPGSVQIVELTELVPTVPDVQVGELVPVVPDDSLNIGSKRSRRFKRFKRSSRQNQNHFEVCA
jgi:hypothetical protein